MTRLGSAEEISPSIQGLKAPPRGPGLTKESAKMLRHPLILTLLPLVACTEEAPDFSLPDVNETSVTYGERVSPRDHLGQVSAYYFGHST